jgi:hypothetical protein
VKKDGYGRLEKEKTSDCVTEDKIVFLLHSANAHSTNTTPNLFIKQGLSVDNSAIRASPQGCSSPSILGDLR